MSNNKNIICQNRKANFDYFIEEKIEAGIVLTGTEVKALRENKDNTVDSHASFSENEMFLYNCYIAKYEKGNRNNHATHRPRKLLLHKNETKKIIGKIKIKGYTLIALSMYFNDKNMVKVELGLAKGKKQHDKRETIKQRDWQKEQGRLIREK